MRWSQDDHWKSRQTKAIASRNPLLHEAVVVKDALSIFAYEPPSLRSWDQESLRLHDFDQRTTLSTIEQYRSPTTSALLITTD